MQAANIQNADELILANGAAEAAQTEALKQIIADNGVTIMEMRDSSARLGEELHSSMADLTGSLTGSMTELSGSLTGSVTELSDSLTGSMTELSGKLTGSIDESRETIERQLRQSGEASHKDSVRVYRNVQASMIAELEKQTKAMSERIDELTRKIEEIDARPKKVQSPLIVMTFIAAAAAFFIELLQAAGFFR